MGLVALSAEDESLAQWGQAWTSCHHGCCSWESHSFPRFSLTGVEFGARMVNIDGKQIKLQIWDTVRENKNTLVPNITVKADAGIKGYDGGAKDGGQSSVQSLSHVRLLATPWTTACWRSLSITNSWSLLKLMSVESVMPCHPTISSSVTPFSSCSQSFPASGSFPMSQFFASGGQSTGVSASASVLAMNIQDWFPLGWTSGSPCSPGECSPTPQFKSINSAVLSFLYSPTLTSIHDYWKNHSLD